jgi:hypothetical protein
LPLPLLFLLKGLELAQIFLQLLHPATGVLLA